MSGDVFGNGMLLSSHIRLVAAFDHRHVFLDPDPDAAAGFAERERLFGLARSTWDDYDRSLISAGGGVFPRTAKAIPLSPEARARARHRRGVAAAERAHPGDPARAGRPAVERRGRHLRQALDETHAEAGDRSNDSVRVDGDELRCRVVGEGGNLGFTQRGRVEYALDGGRIFTDAIDNAGGVNCSDHEVNIKILLHGAIEDGSLAAADRDALLAVMRDAVGERVIEANRAQALALSLEHHDADAPPRRALAVIHTLEARGALDRDLEGLPDDEELANRRGAGQGLTQPELAVLLAHAKMTLRDELVASTAPEDPWLSRELARAFPAPLPERYGDAMRAHRLRREIIATRLTNRLVDRGGIGHALRLHDAVGAPVDDIARATAIAWEVHAIDALWDDVEAVADEVPAAVLADVLLEAQRLARAQRGGCCSTARALSTSRRPWRRSARTSAWCRGCCRRCCTAPGGRRSRSASPRGRRRACPRPSRGAGPACSRCGGARRRRRRRGDGLADPAGGGRVRAARRAAVTRLALRDRHRARPQQPLGGAGADVAARRPVRRAPHADRARAARGGGRRPRGSSSTRGSPRAARRSPACASCSPTSAPPAPAIPPRRPWRSVRSARWRTS